MGTGEDTRHSRPTLQFDSRELARLTAKEIVTVPMDEVEDAFGEWDDEDVPIAAGSQPQAMPTTSRTATLSDPLTTGLLAEVARRSRTREVSAGTLEEAIRSLTPDDDR